MTEQAQKPEKYYIRFSNRADHKNLMEFYDVNAHKNVLKREAQLLKNLIEQGAIVMVEDDKGQIVAASITYPHKIINAQGIEEVKWQEVGTTRIALNGFPGMLDAMVAMQTLRTFLVEPPTDRFVAQMETIPVQNLAKKMGWREMAPPQELLDQKDKTVAADNVNPHSHENWYHVGIEAMPALARSMVAAVDSCVLENKKTGKKIEIDYSRSSFAKMFMPEIRALSAKNLGNLEKPDMKKGVATAQKKWIKNFFR